MYKWSEEHPHFWAILEAVSAGVMGSMLFWVAVILPPAALLGMLAAVGGVVRGRSSDAVGRFWRAIRQGFWTGLLLFLADLALGLIIYVDIRFLAATGGTMGTVLFYALIPVAAVVALVNLYAWPLLAWYPQRFGPLVKRAFFLMGGHPLWALGAAAGMAATVPLLLAIPNLGYGLVVALGPGLLGAIWALLVWQAMKRYAPPDETD